ncbi:SDR family NAD(P)-dependent oxidoreductase [Streptomyces sp. M10(2022)]
MEVSCDQSGGAPGARLRLTVPGPAEPDPAAGGTSGAATGTGGAVTGTLPESFVSATHTAERVPLAVRRQIPVLEATPPRRVREPISFLPAGALVVTDAPGPLAEAVGAEVALTVLSTTALTAPRPGWHHLPEVTPTPSPRHWQAPGSRSRTCGCWPTWALGARRAVAHRGLSTAARPARRVLPGCAARLRRPVHGRVHPRHAVPGRSARRHPHLLGSVHRPAQERRPGARGQHQLRAAHLCHRSGRSGKAGGGGEPGPPGLPRGGRRRRGTQDPPAVRRAGRPGQLDSGSPRPGFRGRRRRWRPGHHRRGAQGGRGGIRPRIHVFGSNDLDSYPPSVYAGSDEEFAAGRAAHISAELAKGRGKGKAKGKGERRSVAELNRSFDRMLNARDARHNLDAMAEHSGVGRVTYVQCDMRVGAEVEKAIGEVLQEHGRIDLLINAAGLQRSALIRTRTSRSSPPSVT